MYTFYAIDCLNVFEFQCYINILGAVFELYPKQQSSDDFYFHVGHEHALNRCLLFATCFDVVEIVVHKNIALVSQILRVSKLRVQNSSEFSQASLNVNSDFSQAFKHVATVWLDEVYEKLS